MASRRAAVLGHPIAHSLSPALHRAAYVELGLDWAYDAVDVTPPGLPGFLDGLGPEWAGLSLTMPLKETVLPLLTSVSAEAGQLAAVNTVILAPGGARHGENTDVTGLVTLLREADAEVGAPVTVLGGGATARSTLGALGRRGVGRVTVVVRRPEAAARLTAVGSALGVEVVVVPFTRLQAVWSASLVVSTLPPGAADPLVGRLPRAPGLLVDVAYQPWPTALATAWDAAGGRVVGGLELLVQQAVEQVRLMTGDRVDAQVLRSAAQAVLAARAGVGDGAADGT